MRRDRDNSIHNNDKKEKIKQDQTIDKYESKKLIPPKYKLLKCSSILTTSLSPRLNNVPSTSSLCFRKKSFNTSSHLSTPLSPSIHLTNNNNNNKSKFYIKMDTLRTFIFCLFLWISTIIITLLFQNRDEVIRMTKKEIHQFVVNYQTPFYPEKVHIITFVTKNETNRVCPLALSVYLNGKSILNLLGTESGPSFYNNNNYSIYCKNLLYREFYWLSNFIQNDRKKLNISDNDILLIIDPFTSIIQRELDDIRLLYNQITKNRRGVIFGGQKKCIPFGTAKEGGWNYNNNNKYNLYIDYYLYPKKIKGSKICNLLKNKAIVSYDSYDTTYSNKLNNNNNNNNKYIKQDPYFNNHELNDEHIKYYYISSNIYLGDPLGIQAYLLAAMEYMELNGLKDFYHTNNNYNNNINNNNINYNDDLSKQVVTQMVFLNNTELNLYVDINAKIFLILDSLEEGSFIQLDPITATCPLNYMNLYAAENKYLPPMHYKTNNVPFLLSFQSDARLYIKNCSSTILGIENSNKIIQPTTIPTTATTLPVTTNQPIQIETEMDMFQKVLKGKETLYDIDNHNTLNLKQFCVIPTALPLPHVVLKPMK